MNTGMERVGGLHEKVKDSTLSHSFQRALLIATLLLNGPSANNNSYSNAYEIAPVLENETVSPSDSLEDKTFTPRHESVERLTKQGLLHPLMSYYFAKRTNGTALVDNIPQRHQSVAPIIKEYGPLLCFDDQTDYTLAWSLLESGLDPKIVANPKSEKYNAAGLFQYIPDTRNHYYRKIRKQGGEDIPNDRTDPRANAAVTAHHFSDAVAMCEGRECFALRGHHAGIRRIVGSPQGASYYYPGYIPLYKEYTGNDAQSLLDRYNEILPFPLVDQFMSLNDNSFKYVAQVIAAQSIIDAVEQNPDQLSETAQLFKQLQKTTSKGAVIDDVHYPFDSLPDGSNIPTVDSVLSNLIDHIEAITDQPLTVLDPSTDLKTWYDDGHAVSALLAGKGVKIAIPYNGFQHLRKDNSPQGLKFKRVRYALELLQMHGLVSFAPEIVTYKNKKHYVYHVGLQPHANSEAVNKFTSLKNRNSEESM